MNNGSQSDAVYHMRRALRLARRGAGLASPNPMVGCVIARDGEVVGEGYHAYARKDHAEVVALGNAGANARGADMFVTLEPCAHVGRTPPCVDAILASGVRRVFVAVRDPNPLVSGRGIELLRQAGVEVSEGILESEAALLNERFFHFIANGRPFVVLKLALSLDGRIACCSGDSQWITGEAARLAAHRMRFECDSVLVGVNTILKDNPLLTVRSPGRRKSITRVVLDSRLQTPASARLFEASDPVVIFHLLDLESRRAARFPDQVELVGVEGRAGGGGLDWDGVLRELARRRITSVLIEGGSRVAGSALRNGVVQKLALFFGGKLIGGDGLAGIDSLGVVTLGQAIQIRNLRTRRVGDDVLVEGYL